MPRPEHEARHLSLPRAAVLFNARSQDEPACEPTRAAVTNATLHALKGTVHPRHSPSPPTKEKPGGRSTPGSSGRTTPPSNAAHGHDLFHTSVSSSESPRSADRSWVSNCDSHASRGPSWQSTSVPLPSWLTPLFVSSSSEYPRTPSFDPLLPNRILAACLHG